MIFMFDLEEKASYIDCVLNDLSKMIDQNKAEELDSEYIQAEIESIIEDILQLQDEIAIFSEKFEYRNDYWSDRDLDRCVEALKNALGCFSNEMTEEILKKIGDTIAYAYLLWNEKFKDDFECWSQGLMSQGLYVSKNFAIFDEEGGTEAFVQMMQNALIAENLFFSLERNKSQALLVPIRNDLIFNRQTNGPARVINAEQLNGRQLITVNIASVATATNNVAPIDLTLQNRLAIVLGWHITGRSNGTRETVCYGGSQIKYQHQPIVGQLANVHTSGVGRYGTGKSGRARNILEVVNTLTQQDPIKEQSLAKLLIRYKRGDGNALSETSLQGAGMQLPEITKQKKILIEQFKKAAYLICFQEVYRRKNQGYRQVGNEVQAVLELPFGLALICVLKLIADQHLKFSDVLGANCLYGVFTGTSVMGENLTETIHKFNELFTLFVQKYALEDYCLEEFAMKTEELNVAFTPQYFHGLLREIDGGEADSDNEDYEVSPVKCSNTKELERLVTNMTITPPKLSNM